MSLNENDIRNHIHTLNPLIQLDILDTIDSTNRFLKNQPRQNDIHVCCAETQTQGRGRFGRAWHSPFGENIYFSARYRLECDIALLSGLSLVVSLAVIQTLDELGLNNNLVIKWPNDILWQERKLSGCLIELIPDSNHTEVIIGIGINVNSDTQAHPLPDKPWCSLLDISGKLQNRNQIIGRLIEHLHQHIQCLQTTGLKPFMAKWRVVDGLYGQWITVSTPTEALSGLANGIDESGRLILIDEHSKLHYLSSGETSLAPHKMSS